MPYLARGFFRFEFMADLSMTTRYVHAGERRNAPAGVPASTPIYAASSFIYERVEEIDRIVEGETDGFVYSRYGNPTVAAFEEAVASIENACADLLAWCAFGRHDSVDDRSVVKSTDSSRSRTHALVSLGEHAFTASTNTCIPRYAPCRNWLR